MPKFTIDEHPALVILNEAVETITSKAHDYAADDDVFANFKLVAQLANVPVMTVFDVLIGTKRARIFELESSGKTPENESLYDSYLDLINYIVLKLGFMKTHGVEWTPGDET